MIKQVICISNYRRPPVAEGSCAPNECLMPTFLCHSYMMSWFSFSVLEWKLNLGINLVKLYHLNVKLRSSEYFYHIRCALVRSNLRRNKVCEDCIYCCTWCVRTLVWPSQLKSNPWIRRSNIRCWCIITKLRHAMSVQMVNVCQVSARSAKCYGYGQVC